MIGLLLALCAPVVDAAPVPAGAAGGHPSPEKRRQIGMSMLKGGHDKAAAGSFRKQLAENPNSVAAHIGLGRALTRQGRCDEALDHLLPFVGTIPFGVEASLAAAVCSRRLGWLEDALWFDHLGADLDPLHARVLTNLALDLDTWGDRLGAEEVIDRLDVSKGDRDPALYVRAVLAIRAGDIDEFDVLSTRWEGAGRKRTELRVLRALTWLDMDDPQSALAELEQNRTIQKNEAELTELAEALRRLGEPDQALHRLDRREIAAEDGLAVAAVRARTLVDLGELAGADAALATWEGALDADVLSARWYIARARGDAEAMAAHAAAYRDVQESPLRVLEHLIPLNKR